MRRVRVLYFAALRESLRLGEETLDLDDTVQSVADLGRLLEQKRSAIAGRLGAVRFAVNEQFVDADHVIADGDVIALVPPVAGG